MLNKKFLIIFISALLILVISALLIYYFFFKEKALETKPEEIIKEETIEPKQPAKKIAILSQEKVLSPTLDTDGKKIKYYLKSNGNIYSVNFDGSDLTRVSAANLAGLLNILWAPDKEKVIGFFQEGEKIKKYLHNYSLGQSTLLNEKINQIVFSPDGKKVAVQYFDETSKASIISLANPDGSDWKDIFQTRLKDLILEWPLVDKISIKTPTSGLVEGLVLTLNPQTGEFKRVLSGIYGLNIKWSTWGNKILYSATDERGKDISLYLVDQNGENKKELGLNTLVEKCVFSQDNRTLFCALPEKLSANAILPDDYYKGLITTSDSFWKINLETGEKNLIYQPEEMSRTYDATELFLSPKEDYLFFINRKDGFLYSLKID